jgi:catechol 2,3-dioxygenase-like lactoylglutathione lyase family enzyme
MRLSSINLTVADPEASASFYRRYLMPGGSAQWLGDALHLRDGRGNDLAFHKGTRSEVTPGAHHGFLANERNEVDGLRARLLAAGVALTDDNNEPGFRSIKLLDPDGYQVEVFWEEAWPPRGPNTPQPLGRNRG